MRHKACGFTGGITSWLGCWRSVAYAKAGSSVPPEMAGEWTLYIRAYLWNIVDSVEVKTTKKDTIRCLFLSLFFILLGVGMMKTGVYVAGRRELPIT
jgi:hypothetical protein